jgi:hypothetical protein
MQADPELGGNISHQYMEELLPMPDNWTQNRYPGLGHNIHDADPERVVNDVIEFFSNVSE